LSAEQPFLGKWRQMRPDTAPAQITVIFEEAGLMTYIVAMNGEQSFSLRWTIDGDTLVSVDQSGRKNVSPFRFASPTMLVLDREDGRYVYRREE
jgi:hypothetical protein